MEKIPKFVKLNNTALRLKGKEYYRDGGIWSVNYKIIDVKNSNHPEVAKLLKKLDTL